MASSYSNSSEPQPGEIDRRYRISITLIAEKRPRYYIFNCFKCRFKVAELSGTMLTISDTADLTVIPDWHPAPFIVKCRNCEFWYEFLSLS